MTDSWSASGSTLSRRIRSSVNYPLSGVDYGYPHPLTEVSRSCQGLDLILQLEAFVGGVPHVSVELTPLTGVSRTPSSAKLLWGLPVVNHIAGRPIDILSRVYQTGVFGEFGLIVLPGFL